MSIINGGRPELAQSKNVKFIFRILEIYIFFIEIINIFKIALKISKLNWETQMKQKLIQSNALQEGCWLFDYNNNYNNHNHDNNYYYYYYHNHSRSQVSSILKVCM